MKLSRNGINISCSPNLIVLAVKKIKWKIDFENQFFGIFDSSYSSDHKWKHKGVWFNVLGKNL